MKVVDDHIAHETAHRLEPLVGTFGDEPEWHNKAGDDVVSGHEAIRSFYAALFHGFPDFYLDIQRKHVAEEATIVERYRGGTHQGDWVGVPATGRPVRIPFCVLSTFTGDDKLKTEVANYDRLSLLSQLGAAAMT